jgi:hypothetical protein
VPVPRVVEPSRKVTVPVGVPEGAVTFAVKVMLVPLTAEVVDAESAVVVATGEAAEMVMPIADEVEAAKPVVAA